MPLIDDPKILDTLKSVQEREGRRTPKRQILSNEEFEEFMASGALPDWAIEQEKARLAAQAACEHAGWNFKEHGRCCFKCGIFMVDFGD